ncbi:MAG: NifU family protein [Flavobacteriales bacterium]|jgi:Fe-S cluster biogenesis protein NfuA|nr:NifU family protein [Flavobacteriales bacterium]
MSSNLLQEVEKAIDSIRPFMEADGGDMQLVEITEDRVVRVRLVGACEECHMRAMTLKAGEDAILKSVPQVTGVEAISD